MQWVPVAIDIEILIWAYLRSILDVLGSALRLPCFNNLTAVHLVFNDCARIEFEEGCVLVNTSECPCHATRSISQFPACWECSEVPDAKEKFGGVLRDILKPALDERDINFSVRVQIFSDNEAMDPAAAPILEFESKNLHGVLPAQIKNPDIGGQGQ